MTWTTVEAFASNRPNKNYVNTKCGRSGCVFRSIRQAKYLPIHRFKVVVVWLSLGNTIGGTTRGLDAGCIVLVVGSEWGTGTLPPRFAAPRRAYHSHRVCVASPSSSAQRKGLSISSATFLMRRISTSQLLQCVYSLICTSSLLLRWIGCARA